MAFTEEGICVDQSLTTAILRQNTTGPTFLPSLVYMMFNTRVYY